MYVRFDRSVMCMTFFVKFSVFDSRFDVCYIFYFFGVIEWFDFYIE